MCFASVLFAQYSFFFPQFCILQSYGKTASTVKSTTTLCLLDTKGHRDTFLPCQLQGRFYMYCSASVAPYCMVLLPVLFIQDGKTHFCQVSASLSVCIHPTEVCWLNLHSVSHLYAHYNVLGVKLDVSLGSDDGQKLLQGYQAEFGRVYRYSLQLL